MNDVSKTLSNIIKHYKDICKDMQSEMDEYDRTRLLSFDLIQIQECIKKLPKSILSKLDQQSIKGLCGVRNHLVHAYDGVDEYILKESVERELPPLIESIVSLTYKKWTKELVRKTISVEIVEENDGHFIGLYKEFLSLDGEYQKVQGIGIPKCDVVVLEVIQQRFLDSDVIVVKPTD